MLQMVLEKSNIFIIGQSNFVLHCLVANNCRDNFPCAVAGVDIAAGEEHFDKL